TYSAEATVHLPPKLIISPGDLVYEVGTTDNQLVWQFEAHESADDPSTYDITVDGNLTVMNEVWQDKVNIIYNVDGLELGVHTVTILVRDTGVDSGAANPAEDEVTITVVEEIVSSSSVSEQTDLSESLDFPTAISFIALVFIGIILKKRKIR
ncbi:MAG: hypothetical protein ACXACU_02890, partial [Candidatus Hodarchaeales archaeon]